MSPEIICPECASVRIEFIQSQNDEYPIYRCEKCHYEFDDYELEQGSVIEISDKGIKRIK